MDAILVGSAIAVLFGAFVALGDGACTGHTVSGAQFANESTDEGGYGGGFPAAEESDAVDAGQDPPASSSASASPPVDDGEAIDASDGNDAFDSMDPVAPSDVPDGACSAPLGRGDLAIDEIMIESVAGTGDDGEWLEAASALDCVANLNGLHAECSHGATVTTVDVTGDVWLPARGTFVIADSSDPAINHELPGLVVVWAGHPGDVLRNQGATITLMVNGALVDTVTYPALKLAVGTSVAFPSHCDAGLRPDFSDWKNSTASWFPAFFGTPNAPNTDVECP